MSTALILEDSQTQAALIARMIEAQGWSTVHCADIDRAMTALQNVNINALFLDIYIGERNTLGHMERFKKLAGNATVTLMTAGSKARDADATLQQARTAEADFLLRKPFSEDQIHDILSLAARTGGSKPKHVLVIDDSRTICLFAKTALEARGYRVSTAHDMEAAFANVDIAHVDLVLCDVFMPGMGGLKGMRTIRSTWPNVRIISMSAGIEGKVSSAEALNASRRIGVDAEIVKPFDGPDLAEILAMVFEAPSARRMPEAAASSVML